ncbi:MAG: RidA family protein [Syntrophorhabdales bacterium]|jgi:2-iminobutanoate/2-iminopropanoate deaminase
MRIVSTDAAPKAIGPYAQGVLATGGEMLFLSGQVGLDPVSGALVEGGIAGQTLRVLANIEAVLLAADMQKGDVVKTTIFLKNLDDFQAVNAIYEEFFSSHRPARSTVQVAALPRSALIEIEAIAVRG